MSSVSQWYQDLVINGGDTRTKGWFLVDSPVVPICVTIAYFVLVTRIGPLFMQNRKPFQLRALILTYNALQVCFCLSLVFLAGTAPYFERLTCMEVLTNDAYRNARLPPLGWLYYMLKYVDLADTVFFVLTKKQRHVTPLHLFHHISMVFATWGGMKFYPSGALSIAPYLNSWVHAAMYAYYFCALYFGKVHIKWKKLMTSIQLTQFVLGNTIFIVHLLNPWCNFPKLILLPTIIHGFVFIHLFGKFYYNTYIHVEVLKEEGDKSK